MSISVLFQCNNLYSCQTSGFIWWDMAAAMTCAALLVVLCCFMATKTSFLESNTLIVKNRGMLLFTNGRYTKVGEPCWWHQTIRVMLAAVGGWTLSNIPTWCHQWAKSYPGYHLVSVCWDADICYLAQSTKSIWGCRYSVILWKVRGSESFRFNLKGTWVSGDPCPSCFRPQGHPASGLSWRTIRPAEQPSWAPLAWLKKI